MKESLKHTFPGDGELVTSTSESVRKPAKTFAGKWFSCDCNKSVYDGGTLSVDTNCPRCDKPMKEVQY